MMRTFSTLENRKQTLDKGTGNAWIRQERGDRLTTEVRREEGDEMLEGD